MFRRFSSLYRKTYLTFSTSSITTTMKLDLTMQKFINLKQYEKALDLFQKQSKLCTDSSIGMALKACAGLQDYQRGINIEKQLLPSSLNNHFIQTSLLQFYIQCHDMDNAKRIFSTIPNKSNKMYAVMFKGYISNKTPERVFDLLDEMIIQPDVITLTLIFNACAHVNNDRAKTIGNNLLDRMSNTFRNDTILLNSAIFMLMKSGDITRAEHLFQLIKKKTIVSYGAMIKGYVENNICEKALDLFEQMSFKSNNIINTIIFNACAQLKNDRGKNIGYHLLDQILNKSETDEITMNSAIFMLMIYGDVARAEQLFHMIKNKSTSAYASIMRTYNLNNQPLKTLKLFEEIKQQNIIPNETIFVLLIGACAQIGILSICQSVVDQIPMSFYDNEYIYNSLIDMWGKAGSVKNAQDIFKAVSIPNIITYTTMIKTFGRNGNGLEAVDLYRQISSDLLNEISHVCVLNACSHSGLLNEAHSIYNEISVKTTRITTTMIDCLSRVFLFDEAETLLDEYEKSNPPDLPMYMAMLSSARNCRDSVLSTKIYNRMKSLFPDEKSYLITGSILLCNIHSSLGDHEQAEDIRLNRIKEYGKKVQIGLTWTEFDGKIMEFRAHDQCHPQSKEIYAELKVIADELIEGGHQFDASWLTRQIHDEETIDSVLCGHSEKLAIAFNFIGGRRPSFIQLTKNLRVCGDCHHATKLIAKIRQCNIIVRDANRLHHFHPSGHCSCQDHF